MRSIKKEFISTIIFAVMLIFMVPVCAFAQTGDDFNITTPDYVGPDKPIIGVGTLSLDENDIYTPTSPISAGDKILINVVPAEGYIITGPLKAIGNVDNVTLEYDLTPRVVHMSNGNVGNLDYTCILTDSIDQDYDITYIGYTEASADGGTGNETDPIRQAKGETAYSVFTRSTGNGTITANRKYATKGTTIEFTVEGEVIGDIKVIYDRHKTVDIVKISNNTYSFVMPDSSVTISAMFKWDKYILKI